MCYKDAPERGAKVGLMVDIHLCGKGKGKYRIMKTAFFMIQSAYRLE